MTDRIRSLVVVLDDRYRVDDVEAIVAAIQMTKGVARVDHGPIDDMQAHVALHTAMGMLQSKILNVFKELR